MERLPASSLILTPSNYYDIMSCPLGDEKRILGCRRVLHHELSFVHEKSLTPAHPCFLYFSSKISALLLSNAGSQRHSIRTLGTLVLALSLNMRRLDLNKHWRTRLFSTSFAILMRVLVPSPTTCRYSPTLHPPTDPPPPILQATKCPHQGQQHREDVSEPNSAQQTRNRKPNLTKPQPKPMRERFSVPSRPRTFARRYVPPSVIYSQYLGKASRRAPRNSSMDLRSVPRPLPSRFRRLPLHGQHRRRRWLLIEVVNTRYLHSRWRTPMNWTTRIRLDTRSHARCTVRNGTS